MLVRDIYEFLDNFAPFDTAEDFDNCGLLIGDMNAKITKIGLALDITFDIIKKAVDNGINLIITHHPVIFEPVKRIVKPSIVMEIIENKISVISAHTNLDRCKNGVNDVLIPIYELMDIINPEEFGGLCRIGTLKEDLSIKEYAAKIKENLGVQAIKFYDSGNKPKKVGFVSGSGSSLLPGIEKYGIDTFITGDIKQNTYVEAENKKLSLIEVGHFDSENIVFTSLRDEIKKIYKEADILILSEKNSVKYV